MPAATADTLTLSRLPQLDSAVTRWRGVRRVVTARRQLEGEGFEVRRPFPGVDLSLADPFVLLDQMGAVEYAPGEAKGTPDHPHRGFETVTYMLDGAFEHTDSTGGGGVITDGDTQWMTAGAGIVHKEVPPQEMVARGGLFHGVQLWVNLPARAKWLQPTYQDIRGGDVTLVASHDAGALVRLIAGDLGGHQGPGSTHTPIVYAHATIAPGSMLATPWPAAYNALAYVLSGRGFAGPERVPFEEGQLVVFGGGDAVQLAAADQQPGNAAAGLDVLLLGGQPIREPVARYGPFVMNTRAELVQAFEDYQSGKMGSNTARRAEPNADGPE